MGFTKLDEGILMSSIMAEDSDTFKVWVALLASCKADGLAPVSSVFLASVCRLDQSVIDHSLEVLASPDAHSRSTDEEGRRIKRVDGGYYIINYHKYRDFNYSDTPGAVRTRRWRERHTSVTCDDVTSHSAYASASDSSSKYKSEDKTSEVDIKFKEFWESYPADGKHDKRGSMSKFAAIYKKGDLPKLMDAFHGYMEFLSHQRLEKNFEQRPMYARTFLNGRWADYVGVDYGSPL